MKKVSNIINIISGVLLVAVAIWFVVSCMQVSNQSIAPWNLIELLF